MGSKPILISTSYDQNIMLWDLSTAEMKGTLIGSCNVNINCIGYDNDRLLAYGCAKKIDVIDVETRRSVCKVGCGGPFPYPRNKAFDHLFAAIGFIGNSRYIYTGGEDGVVRIWDMGGMEMFEYTDFQIYPTQISCIVLKPDETFMFIGTRTGEIFAMDMRNRHYIRLQLPEEWWFTDGIESISVHGNKIVGLTNHGRMMSWNLTTFEMTLSPQERYVWAKIPIEKPTTLGAEIEDEKIFRVPDGEDCVGMSVSHSPNGEKLAVTTSESKMFIVDAESMTVTKTFDIGSRWNHDALFSNTGGFIYTSGDDNKINIWKAETGQLVKSLEGHSKPISRIVRGKMLSDPSVSCVQ